MNINVLVNTIKRQAPEMEVSVQETQKGNVTLTGICIGTGSVKPIQYAEYYEKAVKEHGYDYVAKLMIRNAKELMQSCEFQERDLERYTEWDYVKDKLRLCVGPKETNKDCVTYNWLDLELYVRVEVEETENQVASYKVKTEMLNKWKITKEELMNKASKCMESIWKIKRIEEILYEMTGDPMYLFMPSINMLIITTENNFHGASVIFNKKFLRKISDKMEDDLIIFPSSIHECLVVPRNGSDLKEATELVQSVNGDVVEPEDVLADHAYIFHRDTETITW